jgi:diaminopimelate decarboxylase
MDGLETVDVVGPLCETGDYLALDRDLPGMDRGDLLAIFTAGAYGMSMASRYNSHALPAEVIVDGPSVRLVRQRETVDDLLAHEDAQGAPLQIGAEAAAP